MHPILLVLSRFAALTLALTLAACGGSSDGSSSRNTSAASYTSGDAAPGRLAQSGQRVARDATVDPATASGFSDIGAQAVAARTEPLAVMFEVIENHARGNVENCSAVGAEYGSCNWINVHIKDADGVLDNDQWRLYFHSLRRVLRVDYPDIDVTHVNGDLHYFSPVPGFTGFATDVATVRLVTEFAFLVQSDFMPRAWLVEGNGDLTLLPNTDSDDQWQAYALPITGSNRYAYNGEPVTLATPATRYAANNNLSALAAEFNAERIQTRIVPTPELLETRGGTLDISAGLRFDGGGFSAGTLAVLRQRTALLNGGASGPLINSAIDSALPLDRHVLDIRTDGISLRGGSETALFHGAQSILALVQHGVPTLPTLHLEDQPHFAWRGVHVDVARNFHTVEAIEGLLDQMAAYKLNRLQLHMGDDEGWRLEIPALPELTSVGGRRVFRLDANGDIDERRGLMPQLGSGPFADTAGSGHYRRAEFIALLRAAAARHIEIIPAFDMPGHARAAVVSMRARAAARGTPNSTAIRLDDPADTSRYMSVQHYTDGLINPCVPGTLSFVETVAEALAGMYRDAGLEPTAFHMGGDEAINIYTDGGYQDIGGGADWLGTADLSLWDRPWSSSPACDALFADNPDIGGLDGLMPWFVEQVADRVDAAGFTTLLAYQDIFDHNGAPIALSSVAVDALGVNYWVPAYNGAALDAPRFSQSGYDTVLALPDFLYFDFIQETDPAERGNYWGSRQLDLRRVFGLSADNIAQNAANSVDRNGANYTATAGVATNYTGIQAHLWSETVRSAEQLDYMLFPRLLALAERAWHKPGWELPTVSGTTFSRDDPAVDLELIAQEQALFAAALGQKELYKLDQAGVHYRIPPPGAIATNGTFEMNTSLPGLGLEYSTDGLNFEPYTANASVAAIAVRGRSADGARVGRATRLDN